MVLSNALTSDVTSVRLHELMMIDLALSRLISSVLGIRIVTTTARLMIEVDLGWHVEGFVLLRIAYRYGSTRLARDHWSGPLSDWYGSDRFETRSTATHPERDMY